MTTSSLKPGIISRTIQLNNFTCKFRRNIYNTQFSGSQYSRKKYSLECAKLNIANSRSRMQKKVLQSKPHATGSGRIAAQKASFRYSILINMILCQSISNRLFKQALNFKDKEPYINQSSNTLYIELQHTLRGSLKR